MGEGAISVGANLANIIDETGTSGEYDLSRLKTIPGGAATGLIARGGAGAAQRLGLRDIDVALGSGRASSYTGKAVDIMKDAPKAGKRIIGGGLIEGLEETGQSFGEKVSENWALDKNLLTDTGGETVLGGLTGVTQGGLSNLTQVAAATATSNTQDEANREAKEKLDEARKTDEEIAQQDDKAAKF